MKVMQSIMTIMSTETPKGHIAMDTLVWKHYIFRILLMLHLVGNHQLLFVEISMALGSLVHIHYSIKMVEIETMSLLLVMMKRVDRCCL